MAKDNGPGLFDMDLINSVSRMKVLDEAKKKANQAVSDATARTENKLKAEAMIRIARTNTELITGMTNFMLSHMGMKTFR